MRQPQIHVIHVIVLADDANIVAAARHSSPRDLLIRFPLPMSTEQVGAIPFRRVSNRVEFLIITTRSSGRWICPKGNIEPEHGKPGSASLEALEEAGVEGTLVHPDLGTYEHSGETTIRMWLLQVEQIHDEWPEDHERERQWLTASEARTTVDEPGLAELMETATSRLDTA